MTRWDAVVVGAGFAGLACAEAAARRGLRVLVLDRKREAGSGVHTTGLLTREAVQALRAPPGVLGERLDAIELSGRSGRSVRLQRADAGFLATDTAGLLRALAMRAESAGAQMRWACRAELASRGAEGEPAVVRAGSERLEARHLVACDGAASRVARASGIAAPRRLLAGAERHVELAPGHGLDPRACFLLTHPDIAPGYAAWCVRGVHGAWQAGVLGRAGRGFRAGLALDAFLAWLHRARGARVTGIVETRGGLVPCGGAHPRPWAGSVVAAGDAAGHVSALTAGGIGRAARAGQLLGEGLGAPGDPWKASLRAVARSCGGWRLAAARAWSLSTLLGDVALQAMSSAPGLRSLAEEVAFRPTAQEEIRGGVSAA